MELTWEDGFELSVFIEGGVARIAANRAGLLSLAHHLCALADEEVGTHLHLDAYNSLEEGSAELILEHVASMGKST